MPFGATVGGRRRTLRGLGTLGARALPSRSTAAASRWNGPHKGSIYCFDPDAVPGARYAFRFDTTDIAIPDPASRFNPDGVHAPSEVVDADARSNGTTTTGEDGPGPKPSSTSCTSARLRPREPSPQPPSGSITWPRSA